MRGQPLVLARRTIAGDWNAAAEAGQALRQLAEFNARYPLRLVDVDRNVRWLQEIRCYQPSTVERAAQPWQADAMRAFLITGNPGSGKSTLAAELSRRGQMAIDADDLASWQDSTGMPVDPPGSVDEAWQLTHRWVWNRARIEAAIAASDHPTKVVFVCGIARNQDQMRDLFENVFLLVIEADTQDARLAQATSPQRTEGIKKQIREGRPVFQAKSLAAGAIPLDATASPADLADMVLAVAHAQRRENP